MISKKAITKAITTLFAVSCLIISLKIIHNQNIYNCQKSPKQEVSIFQKYHPCHFVGKNIIITTTNYKGEENKKLMPIVSSFLLILLFSYYVSKKYKNKTIKLSTFGIVLSYMIIYCIYATLLIKHADVSMAPPHVWANIFEANNKPINNIPLIIGAAGHMLLWIFRQLLLVFASYGLGSYVCKYITKEGDQENTTKISVSDFSIKTALGFAALTILILPLSMMRLYTAAFAWIGMIAILFYCRKEIINLLKKTIQKTIQWKPTLLSTISNLSLLLIIASYQFHSIRPSSISYDSLREYMTNAINMSYYHRYISMEKSEQAWGLIMSLGTTLFNNVAAASSFASLAALLFGISFIALLKKIIQPKLQSTIIPLTLIGFFQIPFVYFLMVQEEKPDMAVLFIITTALLSGYKWYQNLYQKKYIFITGLLLAFAITIKLNALIAVIPIITAQVWLLFGAAPALATSLLFAAIISIAQGIFDPAINYICIAISLCTICLTIVRKKELIQKTISQVIILAAAILLFMSPWAINNIYEAKSINPTKIIHGAYNIRVAEKPDLKKEFPELAKLDQYKRDNAETERYIGYEKGHFKYSSQLTDIFTNKHIQGLYISFSTLLLALFPLLIMSLPFTKPIQGRLYILAAGILYVWLTFYPGPLRPILESLHPIISGCISLFLLLIGPIAIYANLQKKRNYSILATTTIIGCLLWLITASGIIWYALPIFIGIFILFALLLQEAHKNKVIWKAAITIILIISTISIIRTENKNIDFGYVYIGYKTGITNKDNLQHAAVNNEKMLAENLNQDVSAKILMAEGATIHQFIANPYPRTIDNTIHFANYLSLDMSDHDLKQDEYKEKIAERFKKLGIKYILYKPSAKDTKDKRKQRAALVYINNPHFEIKAGIKGELVLYELTQ